MRTALIDGDELAYKIAARYQSRYYGVFKDDKLLWKSRNSIDAIESIGNRDDLDIRLEIEINEPLGFQQDVTKTIKNILDSTSSDKYIICLSGDSNFRYDLAKLQPYKGNRVGQDKPGHYLLISDYLFTSHPSHKESHLEADDLLAAFSTNPKYDTIICSTDKDLRTVPALNYNLSKGTITKITEEIALFNFYYQLLIGDDTDNIPHPFLLGDKTALKILERVEIRDPRNYYQTIYPAYEEALQRKDKDGNFKTKWYTSQDIHSILWEVGNLIWMHRTFDKEERWNIPFTKEELDAQKEELISKKERELELL